MTKFKPDETMLQNYIQNKLSPKDTEQLELWLADHPEVMQDLELDIMFSQAKHDLDEAPQPKQTKSFSLWDFLTSRKMVPIHLMAYVLIGFLLFNVMNNSSPSLNSAATFIELEKTRSSEVPQLSYTHIKGNAITIRFFPDSEKEIYHVILKSESHTKEIIYENLQADSKGSITINLYNQNNVVKECDVLIYKNTNKLEQQYKLKLNI